MTDSIAPPDTNCPNCDYVLAGLPATGVCPECAAPIAHALRGDDLHLADPAWLIRIHRGMRCIVWGFRGPLLGIIVALGLITIVLGLDLVMDVGDLDRRVIPVGQVVATVGFLAGPILLGLGIFWFTKPEPDAAASRFSRRAIELRVAIGIGLALGTVAVALRLGLLFDAADILMGLAVLWAAAPVVLLLLQTRTLERRLRGPAAGSDKDRRWFHREARRRVIGFAVLFPLFGLAQFIVPTITGPTLLGANASPVIDTVRQASSIVGPLTGLVLFFAVFSIADLLRRVLRRMDVAVELATRPEEDANA